MGRRDGTLCLWSHEVVPGGFQKVGVMNRFYRFEPPKEEDYLSEEDYQDAVSAWETAEDEYAEDYLEMVRMARNNN